VVAYPHVFFADCWTVKGEAKVSISSLALRYGVSVFEGIRLYAPARSAEPPQPFLLDEHLDRLRSSLALMRLPDPGVDRVPALIDELVERNEIRDDAYVRLAATPIAPGELADDAVAVLSLTATPMGRKQWLAKGIGMSLAISDWQRASAASFPPAAKNISSYAGPRLAWLAARDAGFDGCVLTNRDDRLSEAPTAALFLVRDGELLTPALSEDVLPSITRAWILRVAADLGVSAREAELSRQDAHNAEEAFLCGTGIEIAPIRAFDGRPLSVWPAAPVTRALITHYFMTVRSQTQPLALADTDSWLVAQ
jgi:branched-chain amino acid aminotransferase